MFWLGGRFDDVGLSRMVDYDSVGAKSDMDYDVVRDQVGWWTMTV